ncbi:MAG: hypothetical protein OHK006_06990 [Thermodesulfovibrionales bacterium]
MTETICKRAATVKFWDGYAPWYKLWIEHNNYHSRIIEFLTSMVSPGWKVFDIGAGNGVLSLPLCAIGCDVTALEPSAGMRGLLFEEAFRRGIDWLKVREEKWETLPLSHSTGQDLILACNSLHLTSAGFHRALAKIFRARPKHVLLISELSPAINVSWSYNDYSILLAKTYHTDSSFAYHHMDQVVEHHAFKKGRPLYPHEVNRLKTRVRIESNHLWVRDTATVGIYWWARG